MGESKEVTRDCVQAVRRVKNRCIGNPAAKLEVFSLGIMKALVKGLQHYGGLRDFSVQSDHWVTEVSGVLGTLCTDLPEAADFMVKEEIGRILIDILRKRLDEAPDTGLACLRTTCILAECHSSKWCHPDDARVILSTVSKLRNLLGKNPEFSELYPHLPLIEACARALPLFVYSLEGNLTEAVDGFGWLLGLGVTAVIKPALEGLAGLAILQGGCTAVEGYLSLISTHMRHRSTLIKTCACEAIIAVAQNRHRKNELSRKNNEYSPNTTPYTLDAKLDTLLAKSAQCLIRILQNFPPPFFQFAKKPNTVPRKNSPNSNPNTFAGFPRGVEGGWKSYNNISAARVLARCPGLLAEVIRIFPSLVPHTIDAVDALLFLLPPPLTRKPPPLQRGGGYLEKRLPGCA
ncbi:hypothetical protein AAMO2058_001416400 [Amorphochlora amoebiformis]